MFIQHFRLDSTTLMKKVLMKVIFAESKVLHTSKVKVDIECEIALVIIIFTGCYIGQIYHRNSIGPNIMY